MATIPTYQRQVGTPSGGINARMSGQDPVGATLQQVGDSVSQFATELQRQQKIKADENARAWTSTAISNAHVDWAKRVSQLEESADPGAPGFTDNLLSEFDKYHAETVGNAPDAASKRFLSERLGAMRASLAGQGIGFEAKERTRWRLQQANESIDNVSSIAAIDPDKAKSMLAEQEAIFGGFENKALAQHLVAGMREKAAYAAVSGMVQRDPASALALMDKRMTPEGEQKSGNLWTDMLDGQHLLTLRHQAQLGVQRIASEGRYDIAMRTKDTQAMVMSAVPVPAGVAPTVEEYTRLHGASGPAMWQQEVGNYLQISVPIQQMRTASFSERQQIVDSQRPAAGAGFAGNAQMADAVQQAQKLVEKQIVADPAAYALATSPRVQEAQRQMNEVLAEVSAPGTAFGSATSRQAAISNAVARYAATANAEQDRLGVSLIRDDVTGNKLRGPKLLTNQQANAISDQFHQGGANSAELIQGLEQSWGKYWPQVYAQLASDNKLPPAALVIPNMPTDGSRLRMAQVANMKPDELKALVKPGDLKDLKDQVLSQFDEAQRSFTAQGASGNSTLAVFMEQAEKLATYYMAGGQSAKAAAKQAYTETMGHAYQWADTYRVPKSVDMKAVRGGADAAIEDLVKTGKAQVFTGTSAPETLTNDALRARSMWITNSDESGLELRLRGADGGVYSVLGADGKPVVRSWADLTTGNKTAKAADNTRAGHEEWLRRRQQDLNPRR